MPKKFYACVYGGASEKIDDIHKEKINELGKIIAGNGFSLIYGAGATGCMGSVANGVRENGGYVMGIAPRFIGEFEEIFDCDDTVMVDTMSERKNLMERHADIFFIAPGGVGTMDEFFQVLTLKYLRRITASIVVLNLNGFYDCLLQLMDKLIEQGAVDETIRNLYDVVLSVDNDTLLPYFKNIKCK